MVKITATALQEIKRLQQSASQPDTNLQLQIQPGGCCELYYVFKFTNKLEGVIWEYEDLKVVVEPEDQAYLENLVIDYSEDLMGGGFRFQNPQASNICSCSYSFTPQI